jgi:hypothetical protein
MSNINCGIWYSQSRKELEQIRLRSPLSGIQWLIQGGRGLRGDKVRLLIRGRRLRPTRDGVGHSVHLYAHGPRGGERGATRTVFREARVQVQNEPAALHIRQLRAEDSASSEGTHTDGKGGDKPSAMQTSVLMARGRRQGRERTGRQPRSTCRGLA